MLDKLVKIKYKRKSKRLGRGVGSGVGGHTTGRGGKGATARSGYQTPRKGFEGGQNPISRRLPKLRGTSKKGKAGTGRGSIMNKYQNVPIKLSLLESIAKEEKISLFTIESLLQYGLVKVKFHKIAKPKILFDRTIKTPITIEEIPLSKKAEEEIIRSGGKVIKKVENK